MIRALSDTKVCQMVSTGLYSEKGFDVPAAFVPKLLDVTVVATTDALKDIKSKDYPVAFKYCKPNGDFICAGIVKFFPNEDKDNPGNWNYTWTFDEKDLEGIDHVRDPYDSALNSYFRGASISKYGFDAKESVYYGDVACYLFQCIKKWLDDNAVEGEENGVALDGIIQFRVAVEEGEKVMSAEPDSEIKVLIKDDSQLEC